MSKRKSQQTHRNIAARRPSKQPRQPVSAKPAARAGEERQANSKQAQVLAMLAGPAGASIAAIMEATGWQQHSIRGFFAGVVRKKLQRQLTSSVVDGVRIYRIADADHAPTVSTRPRRRKA